MEVDKLDIDELKTVPSSLNSLKSKVGKADVDKLVTVPVDLKKISDVVDHDVVKKVVYNELVKKVNAFDTSKLFNEIDYDGKIKDIEDKIPSITNLATTVALTAVENKIPNVNTLVKKAYYDAKISEIEKKCFTPSDFNKVTNDNSDAKVK